MKKNCSNMRWHVTIPCIALLLAIVTLMVTYPEETVGKIRSVFDLAMQGLGPVLLIFNISLLVLCAFIAFSKYGKIRLGQDRPEYSTFSYIAMMTSATLASSAVYWSFTEWANYVITPGLGIEGYSYNAYEMSVAYSFFHWGLIAQCVYVVFGLALSYAIYVKKIQVTRVSAICEQMFPALQKCKIVGAIIDLIMVFCTLCGLGVSLGIGIPLIANGITTLTNMKITFTLQLFITLLICAIFTVTSVVGTQKGIKNLSNATIVATLAFLLFLFIFGPSSFILKNAVNSFGLMLNNFFRMALYTDPIRAGGFAEKWTMFFWAFPMTYAGLMGTFISKISKGRTIKELVCCCVLGISIGSWVLFAVDSGVALNCELSGTVSLTKAVLEGHTYSVIYQILQIFPLGKLLCVVMICIIIGFTAAALDSASLALTAITVQGESKSAKGELMIRVFWCVILPLLPLSMLFSGASFEAMKELAILISTPLLIVEVLLLAGFFKWARQFLQREEI